MSGVIDKAGNIRICHSRTERRIVGPGGFLDGENLLPGFHLPVDGVFKAWDWR